MTKYELKEGKMVEVEENMIKIGIDSLLSKKIKFINVFIRKDASFINLNTSGKTVNIKKSGGGLNIYGDNFNFELNINKIKEYDEDTHVIAFKTDALTVTFKKAEIG